MANKNVAHEHIRAVSTAAQRITRLKGEMDIVKGNLKTAEAEFNMAVREMKEYAHGQLAFDLGPGAPIA